MASKTVVDAVEARLAANWTMTPIFGLNSEEETPTDGRDFLQVQYPVAGREHVGMAQIGQRTFREQGVIRLVLSLRRGRGVSQALAWCEQLSNLFLCQQFGGITTWVPSPPVDNDESDRGKYYVLSMGVPYTYDTLG